MRSAVDTVRAISDLEGNRLEWQLAHDERERMLERSAGAYNLWSARASASQ
jgi:hypothetical protein